MWTSQLNAGARNVDEEARIAVNADSAMFSVWYDSVSSSRTSPFCLTLLSATTYSFGNRKCGEEKESVWKRFSSKKGPSEQCLRHMP